MLQHVVAKRGRVVEELYLPPITQEVLPGVQWGDHTILFTPAYWRTLAWLSPSAPEEYSHRLGRTLSEEVVACLLGGYGIPAEIGLAAFAKLKNCLSLAEPVSENEVFKIIKEPLEIGNRTVRYRFPRIKARYISRALEYLETNSIGELPALALRSALLPIEGIGYKTASWITRNWMDSDEVAIIDIHIHRAGFLMDLYETKLSPARDYLCMEERFLSLAHNIEVRPSELDALIWQEMRFAGNIVMRQIKRGEKH